MCTQSGDCDTGSERRRRMPASPSKVGKKRAAALGRRALLASPRSTASSHRWQSEHSGRHHMHEKASLFPDLGQVLHAQGWTMYIFPLQDRFSLSLSLPLSLSLSPSLSADWIDLWHKVAMPCDRLVAFAQKPTVTTATTTTARSSLSPNSPTTRPL